MRAFLCLTVCFAVTFAVDAVQDGRYANRRLLVQSQKFMQSGVQSSADTTTVGRRTGTTSTMKTTVTSTAKETTTLTTKSTKASFMGTPANAPQKGMTPSGPGRTSGSGRSGPSTSSSTTVMSISNDGSTFQGNMNNAGGPSGPAMANADVSALLLDGRLSAGVNASDSGSASTPSMPASNVGAFMQMMVQNRVASGNGGQGQGNMNNAGGPSGPAMANADVSALLLDGRLSTGVNASGSESGLPTPGPAPNTGAFIQMMLQNLVASGNGGQGQGSMNNAGGPSGPVMANADVSALLLDGRLSTGVNASGSESGLPTPGPAPNTGAFMRMTSRGGANRNNGASVSKTVVTSSSQDG